MELLQPGDILNFFGENEIEVTRGEQKLGRCCYRWHDELKKSAVAEGVRVQGALVPGMERKEYTVKGSKATAADGRQWSTSGGKQSKPKQSAPKSKVGTPKKSDNLPPGARWITVHPHGDDSKGVPVLIQERPDGSAVVIGGAGGKLNQLHLGKMRSPQEWKQRATERRNKRAEKEKQRRWAMTDEQRQTEDTAIADTKEYHQTQRHQNALATLKALEEHGIGHGLTEAHKEALAVPPSPDAAAEDVERWRNLSRDAAQVAKRVQQAYEHKLVTDHDARAAARLGDVSLTDEGNNLIENREHTAVGLDGEELSSIVQLPDGRWLVRNTNGDEVDKAFKNWADAAKEHAGNVAQAEDGGSRSQSDAFYSPKDWVRETPDEKLPEGFTFKPEAAAAIASLSRERKGINKSDRDAKKLIQQGGSFSKKGYDVGAVRGTDVPALDDLERDAKTLEDAIANSDLLSLVDMVDAKGLKRHLDFGGYAKLGEISSDILKQNVIDPQIVEALGHNESAKVVAFAIRQNVSAEEYERITQAQAAHHAQMSTEVAQQAVDDAQPLVEQLTSLHDQILQLEAEKGEGGYTPDQLIHLDNLSYQAKAVHEALQKQVGTVVGQLQASAAMTLALESKPRGLRFAAKGDLENAASLIPETWSAESGQGEAKPSIWDGYGLRGDDFELEDGPDGQLVTIKESGLKKITDGAYNEDDRQAYERAIAIKRGDFDEATFLPNGFAYRSKATFTDVRTEAQQFDAKLNVLPGMDEKSLQEAIRGYIGARVANGASPLDVRTDIFSPELYSTLGIDPDTAERTREAL
ncbi:MAG: hypothetical protein AAF986_07375, partial [Pseudomonadota bacterium]